ncbi:MAG: hypothetical protein AAGC96_17970 [Pseudomonadota bacterium]
MDSQLEACKKSETVGLTIDRQHTPKRTARLKGKSGKCSRKEKIERHVAIERGREQKLSRIVDRIGFHPHNLMMSFGSPRGAIRTSPVTSSSASVKTGPAEPQPT